MRVLIAGCGDLGTALGLELAAAGDEVIGLRRHPAALPAPIAPFAADLADPGTLEQLPPVDAVVYAAAADRSIDESYRLAYVEGLRHLLAARTLREHPPARVLFVSSTAVYAQHDGEWIDESSPAEANDFRGRRLREGEELLRAETPAATTTTVLRLSGIYGPGRTRLIDLVRSGKATYPLGPPRYANRIHRDDAAGALVHLLRLPAPAPLYLGTDDAPVDLAEVLTFLAIELGAPLPQPADTTTPGTIERASKRCTNALLKASSYRLRYPTYREGYGDLLRQLAR